MALASDQKRPIPARPNIKSRDAEDAYRVC